MTDTLNAPKCKVRKSWPAICPKGCKAKPGGGFITREERKILLRNKMAKIKEDLTWTQQAKDGILMDKNVKARKKINERLEKAAPAHAPIVRDTPLIRLQRNATRNI